MAKVQSWQQNRVHRVLALKTTLPLEDDHNDEKESYAIVPHVISYHLGENRY